MKYWKYVFILVLIKFTVAWKSFQSHYVFKSKETKNSADELREGKKYKDSPWIINDTILSGYDEVTMKNHSPIFSHSHQDETVLLTITYVRQAKSSKLYSNKILATRKSLCLRYQMPKICTVWLSEIKAFYICHLTKCWHFVSN